MSQKAARKLIHGHSSCVGAAGERILKSVFKLAQYHFLAYKKFEDFSRTPWHFPELFHSPENVYKYTDKRQLLLLLSRVTVYEPAQSVHHKLQRNCSVNHACASRNTLNSKHFEIHFRFVSVSKSPNWARHSRLIWTTCKFQHFPGPQVFISRSFHDQTHVFVCSVLIYVQRIRGFTTLRYINLRFTYLLAYLLTYL